MKILLTIVGIGGVGSTAAVAYSLASNKNAQIEALFQEILAKIKKFSNENRTFKYEDGKDENTFNFLLGILGSLLGENGRQNDENFSKNKAKIKKGLNDEQSKKELEEIYKKIEDFSNLLNDDVSTKDFYKGKIINLLKKHLLITKSLVI